MHLSLYCVFVSTLLLSQISYATKDKQIIPLDFFNAEYSASFKSIVGKATRRLQANNDEQNSATLSIHGSAPFSSIREESRLAWSGNKIQPIEYAYSRSILGQEQKKQLTFDQENKQIISKEKDKTYTIANPEHALDPLSFQLQLQYELKHIDKDTELSYKIASKNELKDYRFRIVGEESLDTELGKLNTIKVKIIRSNKSRITYIWFAKDWNNLLAQLEQYKGDEKEFDLKVTKATVNGIQVVGREQMGLQISQRNNKNNKN